MDDAHHRGGLMGLNHQGGRAMTSRTKTNMASMAAGPKGVHHGCIGKKGAPYAAFFRGVTNVWGVSRSWIAADG
jgi:hypothetical protein